MASLESPLTKYSRASEYVETLRHQLSPLSDLKSYGITIDIDTQTGEELHRFGQVPPMPDNLSPVIGDMLYNFRSSLDHLIWQLVKSFGQIPNTRNEFPIFNDTVEYERQKWGKLRGVSDTVRTIIDALQPCNSTGEYDYWKYLWELQVLSNTDKHRHLILTRRIVFSGRVAWATRAGNNRIPMMAFFHAPVESGAVFFRGEPNMNVKAEPRIEVLFSNAPPAIRRDLPVLNIVDVIYGSVDAVFERLRHHVT